MKPSTGLVFIGLALAIWPAGCSQAKTAPSPTSPASQPVTLDTHPPIPIRFTLPQEGLVTLVIDDASGQRVRNLISETKFPAGPNTVWWDGTDDLLRDNEAAKHGVYHIPGQFVAPGSYRVHGLWRKPIDLRYEFTVYNPGQPPWNTPDSSGNWLANHSPPMATLFVPDALGKGPTVLLGSNLSEGTAGLAWVDLNGRKWKGQNWVGGSWISAPFLARDAGANAAAGVYAYVGASCEGSGGDKQHKKGQILVTALTAGKDKLLTRYPFATVPEHGNLWWEYMGGIAAHDGVIVVSLTAFDKLLFINARTGDTLRETPVKSPRGVAFDTQGRLYVVSGTTVLRDDVVVVAGLEDPQGIALDAQGNIFVSDHGTSHQVKMFSSAGAPVRVIGRPGAPIAGPYDPLHMKKPYGITVDSKGRIWVAENHSQPKRISVWNPDGTLVKSFYGPSEYGGGGMLDPQDKTKLYYNGMEFRLDWQKATDEIAAVIFRRESDDWDWKRTSGPPQAAVYVRGQRYFHNSYNNNPTGGSDAAFIFADRNGIAVPIAAAGLANDRQVLKTSAFKWPTGTEYNAGRWSGKRAFFIWNDLNGDGQMQPDEVTMQRAECGGVAVMSDLSFVIARLDDKAMRFAPQRFTDAGVPVYDLSKGEVLAAHAQGPTTTGGGEALWNPSGWTVLTTPPKPFAPESVGGVFKGQPRWSYPSPWPGLHASHESPAPDRPGELVGTTRLIGGFVTPRGSDAGPIWCINGNQGNMFMFTADGLFVATLFHDFRTGGSWSMPSAPRGSLLNDLSLSGENFWPNLTQTADGQVYLVDGSRMSLIHVEGLETIHRLPEARLNITVNDLTKARAWFVDAEADRQKKISNSDTMKVAIRQVPPTVDGQLDDWAKADWASIDKSGVAAWFDSQTKPYNVSGAVAVAGDRLYAAFRTGDANLLRNTGEVPGALFKTGGALDLMVGATAAASDNRTKPAAGDERLLVTRVNGKTVATLYRAVVPGTATPVPFSSPWRTITLDRVEDVSAQIQFAADKDGNYEFSIPLAVLGLRPSPGLSLKGDIGILRGNGFQTIQRMYWSNKATAIISDVPSEAELTPQLWGRWEFKAD